MIEYSFNDINYINYIIIDSNIMMLQYDYGK